MKCQIIFQIQFDYSEIRQKALYKHHSPQEQALEGPGIRRNPKVLTVFFWAGIHITILRLPSLRLEDFPQNILDQTELGDIYCILKVIRPHNLAER